jgi:hypothetical protein
MEIKKGWQPQPRQAIALACPAFELFYGGAKGGGKSDFLLGDYLAGVEDWGEAWRGIIFRRTTPELDEIIQRADQVFREYPGAQWHATKKTWSFESGATLKFRFLESDRDVGAYNGHQYTWIGFDELTEFSHPGPYIFMLSCSRSAHGAPCYVRSTGNPGRPGHPWVKARFIDPMKPMEVFEDPDTGNTRCFIPAKLQDNTILQAADPGYAKRLMLQPKHLQKAFLEGDWDIVVGQVFEEFTRAKHVIPPTNLGEGWHRFAAMDWGYSKPFSIGWYAVNEDGRIIRYKEWYGCETTEANTGIRMGASAVAKKAWAMSVDEGVEYMIADPACWIKQGHQDNDGQDVPSIAESFMAAGFKLEKANNERINGLARIHDLMKGNGLDGRPMFMVADKCFHWLRTVPYLTADPRDPEDIDTSLEDHAYDEFRYAIMSRFALDPRSLRKREQLRATKTPKKSMSEYDLLRAGL